MRKASLIQNLFNLESCKEFQEYTGNWSIDLTLPEAQKLTQHIEGFSTSTTPFNLAIIHTYTSELLDPWFDFHAAINGINLNTYHAPYGMNILEAEPGSRLVQHRPDLTLFMLRREDLHPQLKNPLSGLTRQEQEILQEEAIDHLIQIISQFRKNISGRIAVCILPAIFPSELGIYCVQNQQSETFWWPNIKQRLSRRLTDQFESAFIFDLDTLLIELGQINFFDLRYWYTSRFPFKPMAANEFARKILDIICVILKSKTKVIVLDADNTLWGGIIGEDGIDGIALGPDYPGNAYMDFQRRILDYRERGFVLALCSKNNYEDVIEVLNTHPHQLLKEQTFSAMRINWASKHVNLMSLAEELNLGLDSFIFVDDSDYECDLVRKELPQVHVIQTPKKPVDIPRCLDYTGRLEILSLTQEDKIKGELYRQEHNRKSLLQHVNQSGGSVDDYLASLQMSMVIELNPSNRVIRLAQLSQKTNQFNLTTKRYTEQEIQDIINSNNWLVASFSLKDCYGESGVVGLITINIDKTKAYIDTFLMSCRVIGRKAETVFFEAIMQYLLESGICYVFAEYKPTLKNRLVADFYKDHQFSEVEQYHFSRSLSDSPPLSSDSFPIITAFC
jgi:FkbH-like protein